MKWIQDLILYIHTDKEGRPSEIPLLPDKKLLNHMKHGKDYHFVGSSIFLLFENKFGRTTEKAFDKNRIDISIVQGEIEWPLDWPLPLGFEKIGGSWNRRMEWTHLLVDFNSLVHSWKVCFCVVIVLKMCSSVYISCSHCFRYSMVGFK
jgi:hypothetical protein